MNVIAFLMGNKPDSAKIHQNVDIDSSRKVHDFRYFFFVVALHLQLWKWLIG